MDKSKRIGALVNGKGIQYLLDAAYLIMHNPITMYNADYNLIAYVGELSGDPIWSELVSTGTYSMSTREFFARESMTESAANAQKKWFVRSKNIVYNRLLIYIFNKEHIKVAVLTLYERNAFNEDDVNAFEKLADIIIYEIRSDADFTAYGRAFHEDKIVMLLDGAIKEPILYTPQVQILYDDFEDYLYVAVVGEAVNAVGYNRNDPAFYKNMLIDMFGSFKFAVYTDYVVMILSSKYNKLDEKLLCEPLNGFFSRYDLYAGISDCFESLYELREYYDKAVNLLKNGVLSNIEQRYFT